MLDSRTNCLSSFILIDVLICNSAIPEGIGSLTDSLKTSFFSHRDFTLISSDAAVQPTRIMIKDAQRICLVMFSILFPPYEAVSPVSPSLILTTSLIRSSPSMGSLKGRIIALSLSLLSPWFDKGDFLLPSSVLLHVRLRLLLFKPAIHGRDEQQR